MAGDFLASRGRGGLGSPRDVSRGVVPQGKKIARPAVAAKAVEAQPSFGQISRERGRVVRLEYVPEKGNQVRPRGLLLRPCPKDHPHQIVP